MKPVVLIVILIGVVVVYGIFQSVSLSKDHEYFRTAVEGQLAHMSRTGDDAIKAEITRIAGANGIDPATLQVDINRSETPGAPHVPGMYLPGQTTRALEVRVRYTRPILFWNHEFEMKTVVRKVNTPHPQEKSMQDALKELMPKPATQ